MKKIIISMFMTLAFLAMSVGTAFAQDTTTDPIIGTVVSVSVETDASTGEPFVAVKLVDSLGVEQTVNLNVETATLLGLVTTDLTTGEITVIAVAGSTVEIDPATVIGSEVTEKEHPVGSALADFFSETLGVDYELVMDYHDQGAGFGVIAQALWITTKMEGDTALFQTILDAKLSGDYSGITLEDGSSPKNWGQFKKAILKGENNNSVGDIMSGRSENSESQTDAINQGNKNKEDKGNHKNKDKHNKKHNGNGNGNGN